MVRSTDHEANLYAVSSSFLLPPPTQTQISSSAPCSSTPSAFVPPLMQENQVSHLHKITGEVVVLYSLIFTFLGSKWEDKRFWTEWQQASCDLIAQKLFNEGYKPWSSFLQYPVTSSILGCIEFGPEIQYKLYMFVSVVVFSFEIKWYYQWQCNSGLLQFRVQIIVVCVIVRGQVSNL